MSLRPSPGRPLLALMMAVVAILPGCSLILVDGPPEGHEQVAFDCTERPVLPVLDLATAGLSVAAATGAEDEFFSKDQNTAINAGFALLLGVSAWTGFQRTSACRAAKADLRARLSEQVADSMRAGRR